MTMPLSPEREAAIRSEADRLAVTKAEEGAAAFDVQVVVDLLGEVDRLRSKLQLAAHARDLIGQAGPKLRDACEDITSRPAKFRQSSEGKGGTKTDQAGAGQVE
jgi:hypothetical protein